MNFLQKGLNLISYELLTLECSKKIHSIQKHQKSIVNFKEEHFSLLDNQSFMTLCQKIAFFTNTFLENHNC